MFGHLASKATAGKTGSAKTAKKAELPLTNAFVLALMTSNLRLSYGALADASELLGEHTASGLSAGQRGSQICKNLRVELQPQICRSNGSYAKGTEWPEVPTADIATLKKISHVKPEVVAEYVQAFIDANDAASETVIETPAEAPDESLVEALLDDDDATGLESDDDPSDDDAPDPSVD